MKYEHEFNEGGDAYCLDYPTSFNPYATQTQQWYAWNAGHNYAARAEAWFDAQPVVQTTEVVRYV